jgi:aryl-alcohol dehydrogenase-like predicted oxidoreductase
MLVPPARLCPDFAGKETPDPAPLRRETMEYRQLGNSGLKVSVLTMGTMTFGGEGVFAKVGNVSLDSVRRLIDMVADAGVNLIDTADIYSAGASETMLARRWAASASPAC